MALPACKQPRSTTRRGARRPDRWPRSTRRVAAERGKLEVIVANSTLMQEFTFQKPELLKALARLLPEQGIDDLRFRVGTID